MFISRNFEKEVEKIINKIFSRDINTTILNDILLEEYIQKNDDIIKKTKKIKQIQMKIGELWQRIIGIYGEYIDLKQGHHSGLDIINENKKIVIELKNRYNTDNASSRKSNYDKLAKFKQNNPNYECVYGIINDKTIQGEELTIIHNGVKLKKYSGNCFLNYIFGENKDIVLNIIRNCLNCYLL